ncbi:flagellar hook-length control protein FliK [Profundibacter sp.]
MAALETAKPPTLPKAAVSDATQPPAVLKVDAPQIIQSDAASTLAAFKSHQSIEAPKGATGDANKTKAPTELAASKTTRPKPPARTVAPEITGIDAFKPLETPEFVPLEARSVEAAPFVRQDANLNRPEVMRHVAQQLTDAARQMPDRPVELVLNPEELGRLRLTFTTTDAGLHVAIAAERGETMDLLRRYIDSLAQDFRDLGYRDVKFDFSGNGAGSDANTSGNENADQDRNTNPDAAPQDIDAPIKLSLEPLTGLDLRL